MTFTSRDEFTNAQASEKITLVHVHATKRMTSWTPAAGGSYYKVVNNFVVGMSESNLELTYFNSYVGLPPGSFHYDVTTSRVYVHPSTDPANLEMVATIRYFFSNATVNLSWDFSDTGEQVSYVGRIKKSPGYKHLIGIDQGLTSLVGSGDLILQNTDGFFDDVYDTQFFENQEVTVYSWNRDLNPSDVKLLFRGKVTAKSFSSTEVKLSIKDAIFDLQQNVPQGVYDDNDTVNDSVKGSYKRWLYGRVAGLKLQSIDQIGDGYDLTGTISGNPTSVTLTGSGTSFLSDFSTDDTLLIGTQEFTVEVINSDTSLDVSEEPTFTFTSQSFKIKPDIPTVVKNRTFFVADHACSRITTQISAIAQLNRVVLVSVDGLLVGDFLEFTTGERIEIKNIAPGNLVVLRQNLVLLPTVGSDVVRQPVQQVFIESLIAESEDFTISNLSSGTTVTVSNDAEFNLARNRTASISMSFANGSRSVTGSSTDLREVLKPRDWIRPQGATYTTYYEILAVDEFSLTLRLNFTDPTTTDNIEFKQPAYIGDDTIVSADALGRTEDNNPDGTWISTAPQAIKDSLLQIGITSVNSSSFTVGQGDTPQIISMTIPSSPGTKGTTVKAVVDDLAKTVLASVTLDNDLNIKYTSLLVKIPEDIETLTDKEIKGWGVEGVNSNIFRNSIIRYRHKDIDRATLETGNSVTTFASDFVRDYIGTDKTNEVDVRMYLKSEAETRAHREVYMNRLSRAKVNIRGDLRLERFEIGQAIKLSFRRLYKRLGDGGNREKVLVVMGKTVTQNGVDLLLTDVGNVYNTSSIITPNTAPDFASSNQDEKLRYGYITDEEGIVDDDEDTANIHLIS